MTDSSGSDSVFKTKGSDLGVHTMKKYRKMKLLNNLQVECEGHSDCPASGNRDNQSTLSTSIVWEWVRTGPLTLILGTNQL